MSTHAQVPVRAMKTASVSFFTPKPQSPTGHLKTLRCPNPVVSNTTPYLSPGLHNVPDTWVRYLGSQVYQFFDKSGAAKNQHLLKGKGVQERKYIHQWCDHVKNNARTFILGTYDDEVAAKEEEHFDAQAGVPAVEDWSADYELQDEQVDCAVEDWSDDFEKQDKDVGCAIEDWSVDFEETNEQVSCAIEDWSADFEESDEQVSRAIEDWSADFEDSDEEIKFDFQLENNEGEEALGATLRPTSSCSSVSTEYDTIFDSDEDSSDDDETMSVYAHCGPPLQSNGYEGSTKGPFIPNMVNDEMPHLPCESPAAMAAADAAKVELQKKEEMRKERMLMAEHQLASAWHNWEGRGYQLTQCTWLPIKFQFRPDTIKEIAKNSPVPFIQVTGPEGQVCDIIEREAAFPMDFIQYAEERDAAQARMKEKLRRWRSKNETYSQYCRRLNAEAWWKEKEEETAREIKKEERVVEVRGVYYYY